MIRVTLPGVVKISIIVRPMKSLALSQSEMTTPVDDNVLARKHGNRLATLVFIRGVVHTFMCICIINDMSLGDSG